jgi:F-box-like
MSIDTLPDEVLLEIFDFFVVQCKLSKEEIDRWHPLVHVCRRWRRIVFESPRRLNLRLVGTAVTPARDTLDDWPALPLFLCEDRYYAFETGMDNIIAVLERSDRVDQIILILLSSFLEQALAAMLVPFPGLTDLKLKFQDEADEGEDESMLVLPDSFLGRSAPRLETLSLDRVPFPGLPNLLLSTTHLVDLSLARIPHSGYISPESMATVLSTLVSLDDLHFEFQSQSHSDRTNRSPISTRSVLPALTCFSFSGVSEYSEDFLARIDAPRLRNLSVTFDHIVFDTPQLVQFIRRTPRFKVLEEACVAFERVNYHTFLEYGAVRVRLSSKASGRGDGGGLSVGISVGESNWPPSFLVRACTSCLSPLSMKVLHIDVPHSLPGWLSAWLNDVQDTEWLEVFHPFAAVTKLYLDKELAQPIAVALKELDEGGTTEVLPALRNIIIEGPRLSESVQEAIGQFIAARQVDNASSLPIAFVYRHRLY